jgi:ATP-dependent DNA ligase
MNGIRQCSCRCGANAAVLFASDLIEHDGDLRDLPLIDRKRRLAELIAVTRDGQTAFAKNWSLAQYASRSQRERAPKTPS